MQATRRGVDRDLPQLVEGLPNDGAREGIRAAVRPERIERIAVNVTGEYLAEGLTQLHLSVKNFARARQTGGVNPTSTTKPGPRPNTGRRKSR